MCSVPFFNYPALFTSQEAELQQIFCDVGHRGAFIKQIDLEVFEKCLASFLGVRHVLGVGNATDGLEVAVRPMRLRLDSRALRWGRRLRRARWWRGGRAGREP